MQKLKKRKGFTLTELAIVIAVIAILIAVLVPTFISLINKAKESNDSQLAKNMNTTLSTYATINGDVDTPHEALSALEEDGYLLKNMTPTSEGYSYIWDEETNTVALIDDKFNFVYNTGSSELTTDEEDTTLWAIVSTQSQVDTFRNSSYAFKYCVVATESVTVDNSFDSYYAEDANVILEADGTAYTMYTNGGEYTVNAPNATVEHYGTASLVNVTAVANKSYHVYGEVKMAVLTAGRLVVEEDATVSILAVATTTTTDYTVEVKATEVSEAISTIYVASDSNSGATTSVTVTTSSGETTTTAIQSTSVADGISGITYITTEDQFESFISSGAGMAILKANVTIDSTIALDSGKFVSIDLNGYTLTSTNTSDTTSDATNRNTISNYSELTVSNGKLLFNQICSVNRGVFVVESNSKFTLNNVEATTNGAFLFPKGDAAEVNVINSTITSTGSYCVGTNANDVDNYGIVINLQGSTLVTNQDTTTGTGATCAVMINVPGTLIISDCTITGQRQGVVVRAGTATITDTTITCTGAYTGTSYYIDSNSEWGSGNDIPMGALIIGNKNGTYAGDATVYCYNVTANYKGNTENGFNVYMYGGVTCYVDSEGKRSTTVTETSTPNKAILNYDSACNLGTITRGEETYTKVNTL